MNNYIIEGDNNFLIKKEIDKLIKNKDLDIIKIDLETSNINNVIETLDTYDLFLKQKLVIVTNPMFFNNVDDNFPINNFLKYLKNPSENTLIFITNKINKRLKLVKEILPYFKYIELNNLNPYNFIKDNLGNFKMDNLTISYFLNQIGNNYYSLYNELNKLKLLKLNEKIITKDDINLICKKNINNTIFDLIDAIINKQKNKTIELYNYFINNGTEIFQILVLLSNQIRLIYNVKILSKLKDFEISNILNVKEYPIKLARSKGLNYTKKELLDLLYNLASIDEGIKSGKLLPNISFISYLLNL